MSNLQSRTGTNRGERKKGKEVSIKEVSIALDAAPAAAAAPTIMEVPEDLKVDPSLLSVGRNIGVSYAREKNCSHPS